MGYSIVKLQDYRENILPDDGGEAFLDAESAVEALDEALRFVALPQNLLDGLVPIIERLDDAALNDCAVSLSWEDTEKMVRILTLGTRRVSRLFKRANRDVLDFLEDRESDSAAIQADLSRLHSESPREFGRLLREKRMQDDETWEYMEVLGCVRDFFDVNAAYRKEERARGRR